MESERTVGGRRGATRPYGPAGVLLALVSAVVLALVGAAPAAAGDGGPAPQPEVVTVSGSFTATGQLLACVSGGLHQIVDGGGEWSGLAAATFHLDYCLGPPPDGVNYPVGNGTFTVTAPDGTLTGPMGGSVQASGTPRPEGYPLHLELIVAAGTGRYVGATGTLVLDGAFSPGAVSASGTVSGTLTIPPPVPDSVDDCRHGGWRRHVDDQGRPFRSQRHCVAFVRQHGG